jgi:hypothetical protein
MPASVYPDTLPGFSQWAVSPRERATRSALAGDPQARRRWRDKVSDAPTAVWHYSAAEMAIWRPWFHEDLVDGQLWFQAEAPGEGGFVDRVMRFRPATVRVQPLGNGGCRVTAQMELRGRSAAPMAGLVENFFFTGAVQETQAPEWATQVLVQLWGAPGGRNGGRGGYVEFTLPVGVGEDIEPGDDLEVYVGGRGQDVPTLGALAEGGWPDGGGSPGPDGNGGGGGGRTEIRKPSAAPLGAAGGGGGGGGGDRAADQGGDGGGEEGEDGVGEGAGGGATPLAAGAGGVLPGAGGGTGNAGSEPGGGGGGNNTDNAGGGGGGGGVRGGGGGGSTNLSGAPGGGGAGKVPAGGSAQLGGGPQPGSDGRARLTWS